MKKSKVYTKTTEVFWSDVLAQSYISTDSLILRAVVLIDDPVKVPCCYFGKSRLGMLVDNAPLGVTRNLHS